MNTPYGGTLGYWGPGIPLVESRLVTDGRTIISMGGTLYVQDALRFKVRLQLHEYIDRRVRETYVALGLA